MVRQEDNTQPQMPSAPSQTNQGETKDNQAHKKVIALLAGLLVVILIIVVVFSVPQGSGSPIQLSLNYTVGEHMVYTTTNVVTNQMYNSSIDIGGVTSSTSFNSTSSLDVLSFDGQTYSIKQTVNATIGGQVISLPLTINVSKTNYYDNFIAPGPPLIFYNSSGNPTISAYLAQSSVNVGDVWTIPVNTGNSSLGLTGEVTLTFAGFQDVIVPAGTYKTFSIEVTSSTLNIHSDGSSLIIIPNNMTLQLKGTSYLEQGTCHLIKANLTQVTAFKTNGIEQTSTIYTEKTLVKDSL
jgi:hypothetical protein